MMLRKLAGILAVWLLGLTLAVAQGPAPDQPAAGGQDQPSAGQDQGQPGGARGMRGQRGQMRGGMGGGQQMMLEQLKTQLKATDDEWKALEPLIQAVMTAERDAMVGGRGMMGRGMMGGRGNRGAGGPGGAPTDSAGAPPADNASGAPAGAAAAGGGRGRMGAAQQMPEREALQKAVDAEQPNADDIKAKLKAYKEAVAKKQEALKEARAKLREVCDARKDAVLVLAGILD